MLSKRILLIDDKADIHKIARIGLMMETGWELLSALSSREGIAIAAAEQPDVILLDAIMPDRDGVVTLQLLQASPDTQAIPVIFLTAQAQAADQRLFYSLGANGVITKPFDPMTLASQIANFLSWQL